MNVLRGRLRLAVGIASLAVLLTAVVLAACVALPVWFGGWHAVSMESGSMRGAFAAGDVALVSHAPRGPLAPGTIVTFDSDGRTVTHRIVRARPDGSYVTRGDANDVDDSTPVKPAQIVGVVRVVVPYVGLPREWVRTARYGALLATALVFVGLSAAAADVISRPRGRRISPGRPVVAE